MLSRIPALTLAESYAAGDAYEYGAAFARAARAVLGEALAGGWAATSSRCRIAAATGSASAGRVLRDRYAAFDHPAAREIVAWLDGHWAVTDELVQTQ